MVRLDSIIDNRMLVLFLFIWGNSSSKRERQVQSHWPYLWVTSAGSSVTLELDGSRLKMATTLWALYTDQLLRETAEDQGGLHRKLPDLNNAILFFFNYYFITLFFTLQYWIGFAIHQHASATGVQKQRD